jgi:hypothetical protein
VTPHVVHACTAAIRRNSVVTTHVERASSRKVPPRLASTRPSGGASRIERAGGRIQTAIRLSFALQTFVVGISLSSLVRMAHGCPPMGRRRACPGERTKMGVEPVTSSVGDPSTENPSSIERLTLWFGPVLFLVLAVGGFFAGVAEWHGMSFGDYVQGVAAGAGLLAIGHGIHRAERQRRSQ